MREDTLGFSPHAKTPLVKFGGLLYQLWLTRPWRKNHRPVPSLLLLKKNKKASVPGGFFDAMVGERGFEPRTSVLSGQRSNRLSYSPFSWF